MKVLIRSYYKLDELKIEIKHFLMLQLHIKAVMWVNTSRLLLRRSPRKYNEFLPVSFALPAVVPQKCVDKQDVCGFFNNG